MSDYEAGFRTRMHVAATGALPGTMPASLSREYRLGFRHGIAGEIEIENNGAWCEGWPDGITEAKVTVAMLAEDDDTAEEGKSGLKAAAYDITNVRSWGPDR